MVDTQIAQVMHEVNRMYCAGIGDNSQPEWESAPDWQRKSALDAVKFHRQNPMATASATHDAWAAAKHADGWVHGLTKDAEAKTHPCLVTFEALPIEQQLKDVVARAVVHSLLAL